jgi:hypothetical protein
LHVSDRVADIETEATTIWMYYRRTHLQ